LRSILLQTLPPAEVIVVESGPFNTAKQIVDRYMDHFKQRGVRLKYLRNLEGSLTLAKDIGIQNATFELVSFLDDDMVIHKDYYKAIMEVYEKIPYALGVMGKNLLGRKEKMRKIIDAYQKVFLIRIDCDSKFRVLPSLGNTYSDREGIIECEWLSGCATFKKEVLLKIRPDKNLKKYSENEDIDLSYRIYKKYPGTLFMTTKAKYLHGDPQMIRNVNRELLYMTEVYNLYLFYKNIDQNLKNKIIYIWSRIGRMFLLSIRFLIYKQVRYIPDILFATLYCLKNMKNIIKQDLNFFNKKLGNSYEGN
jgi:glycosyltransferase involved in cell wall biosynthesis